MSSKKRDLDADVDDSEDNATIDAARRMFDAPDEPIPRAGRPMPGVMPRRPASNGLSPSEHMALGGDPARRARIADMKARAERMARRRQRGLWSQSDPLPPWRWRQFEAEAQGVIESQLDLPYDVHGRYEPSGR